MDGHEPREVWDLVAEAWDRNEAGLAELTGPVRRRLVERLAPRPGDTILELAAGTGAVGRSVAPMVEPEGQVRCTDIAPRMVDAARRRAAEEGVANVRCSTMDAQNIPLPGDSVDAVVCSFGFMLMPRPELAFRESRRVLRADGRLVLSVWGAPENNPWLLLIGGALLEHGHVVQADPMGPGGVFSMSDAEALAARLEAAGFAEVRVEPIDVVHRTASFEEYWGFHTATSGPIATTLAELDADAVAQVRSTCESFCAGSVSDQGWVFPGQALVATAAPG